MNPHIVLYSLLMGRIWLTGTLLRRAMIVETMWQFIFITVDGACVVNQHINEMVINCQCMESESTI